MKSKPRVLRDLHSRNAFLTPFLKRINLSRNKVLRIPLISFSKAAVIFGVFSYLVFGSALAPVSQNQLSMAAESDAERQQLEKQLEELEKQVVKYLLLWDSLLIMYWLLVLAVEHLQVVLVAVVEEVAVEEL